VFVTNMDDAINLLVWFYQQRAGAENLIKGAPAKPARSRW
jgi:hypothetical protein